MAATSAWSATRSPLDGVGELAFVADLPVFYTSDGRARLDLVVRLDHGELVSGGQADRKPQSVSLSLKLAREGQVAIDTTQVFYVEMDPSTFSDDAIARYELLEMNLPVRAGRWAVSLSVAQSKTFGREGHATGVLDVFPPQRPGARFSDAEFRIASGDRMLPNPARIYGVVQDTLEVYWEVAGSVAEVERKVEVAVRDPEFGVMDVQTIALQQSDGPITAHRYRLGLLDFPQGNYILELRPAWDADRTVEAEFSVNWDLGRTLEGVDDLLLEAQLVLAPIEFEKLRRSSRARQSEVLQEFWWRHDPTTDTVRNELREKFLERVAYARRFYGDHERSGPLTDRGRTYVRYGPPAQVELKVMPPNGADLDEAIESVHETFVAQVEGAMAREALEAGDRPVGLERSGRSRDPAVLRDRRRNQARIGREGSFEVWYYNLRGDPLFEEGGWSENLDLRFLFVDRTGTGLYRLEYSSLPHLD